MEYALSDQEFDSLRKLIYKSTGIKLADGKRHMLRSRLSRRLRALSLNTFSDYFDLLVSLGPTESESIELINAVTTNKTDFYREPHHFDFVVDRVLPEIESRTRAGGRKLSVWHAGCSTGEEAYTLSIALHESLSQRDPWQVRQLATDIDTNVLEVARRGRYDIERLNPVPQTLRPKYFLRGTGNNEGYVQIKSNLAEWLTLRRLNLLDDPWPFNAATKFDLIFCRNVMIYFDKPTQKRLVERFEQMLSPGGYLLIGHSESLFGISNGFRCLGQTIYQRLEEKRVAA